MNKLITLAALFLSGLTGCLDSIVDNPCEDGYTLADDGNCILVEADEAVAPPMAELQPNPHPLDPGPVAPPTPPTPPVTPPSLPPEIQPVPPSTADPATPPAPLPPSETISPCPTCL